MLRHRHHSGPEDKVVRAQIRKVEILQHDAVRPAGPVEINHRVVDRVDHRQVRVLVHPGIARQVDPVARVVCAVRVEVEDRVVAVAVDKDEGIRPVAAAQRIDPGFAVNSIDAAGEVDGDGGATALVRRWPCGWSCG